MCGGPDNVTSTTSNEPPGFLQGPLGVATNAASDAFIRSQGGSTSNNNFGGFGAPPTTTPPLPNFGGRAFANDGVSRFADNPSGNGQPPVQPFGSTSTASNPALGTNGNQLLGQAEALTSQTLAGDFLDPNSNPFLESTFNRAADLTQTKLASQFGGAGRNLDASLPARSEELQTLASNIFGGNFQQERSRQANAITDAQGLDPLNQFINRIGGIIPGAGGVTTSTQPVFKTGLFG